LSCMWDDGIYLGVKGTTGEMIVGNKEGVWRTRTVRRKTLQERRTRDNLEMVGGVPWQMGEKEGEDLKLEVTIMDKDYKEKMRGEAEGERVPRRMFIKKEDVEEHGYTVRCPGCVSILRGTARQEHSMECRRRLEKELGVTERAKRAKKKVGDYVERKMEEDEEVRKKRSREKLIKENSMDDGVEEKVDKAEKRKRDDDDDDGEDERTKPVMMEDGGGGSSGAKKRSADDEESEEKTAKYIRKLERRETKRKEREGGQDEGRDEVNEVVIAGQVVNEEAVEATAGMEDWPEPPRSLLRCVGKPRTASLARQKSTIDIPRP
jgi:hypothetical protein